MQAKFILYVMPYKYYTHSKKNIDNFSKNFKNYENL